MAVALVVTGLSFTLAHCRVPPDAPRPSAPRPMSSPARTCAPPSWLSKPPRQSLLEIPKRIPKKLRFSDGVQEVCVLKRGSESMEHVLMKVMLWQMYGDDYPGLLIEEPVGDRYLPDCVCRLPGAAAPVFWGECGRVDLGKVESIALRYPSTHFVLAKWGMAQPVGFASSVSTLVAPPRTASGLDASVFGPVEVLSFPADSADRFFSVGDGQCVTVAVDKAQVQRVRVWPPP